LEQQSEPTNEEIMKGKFEAKVLILIFFILTVSCKSYRNVERLHPKMERNLEGYFIAESEFEKIKKGEKILVKLTSGEKHYMYFASFEEKILRGQVWVVYGPRVKINPSNLEIPLEKIYKIKVLRFDPVLTIGIPVGLLGGFFTAMIISWYNFGNSGPAI
jgi:hypothetical protein